MCIHLVLQAFVCLEVLGHFYLCEHSFTAFTVLLACVRSRQSSKTWPWLALEPNTKQEPPVNDSGKEGRPESHKVGCCRKDSAERSAGTVFKYQQLVYPEARRVS